EGLWTFLPLLADLATTPVEVTDDFAQVVGLGDRLDSHDRLKELWPAGLVCLTEAGPTGDFESQCRAVHVMVLAVDQTSLEIDYFIACDLATLGFGTNRMLDSRDELA